MRRKKKILCEDDFGLTDEKRSVPGFKPRQAIEIEKEKKKGEKTVEKREFERRSTSSLYKLAKEMVGREEKRILGSQQLRKPTSQHDGTLEAQQIINLSRQGCNMRPKAEQVIVTASNPKESDRQG